MRTVLLGWVLLAGGCCWGQVQAGPVVSGSAALLELAAEAKVVFAGRVTAVDRADAAGYVDVRFGVERAVRGVSARTYVLREWAGLWTGVARYRVGQRLLMLLPARGPSGLSAPVGGMDGAVPLVGGDLGVVDGGSAAEARVDLRWVRTRGGRAVVPVAGAGAQDVGDPHPLPVGGNGDWVGPVVPFTAAGSDAVSQPTLSEVLAILGSGTHVRR